MVRRGAGDRISGWRTPGQRQRDAENLQADPQRVWASHAIAAWRRRIGDRDYPDPRHPARHGHASRLPGFASGAPGRGCRPPAPRRVAERERAQDAARTSQALVQAIAENSPAAIFVKDLAGRYLLINRRCEELFHVQPGKLQNGLRFVFERNRRGPACGRSNRYWKQERRCKQKRSDRIKTDPTHG